jgi:ABC-type phosphate transport system substrate-binding protein
MPMTDDLLASSKVKLIHIPTVLGAVVPIFNVPGVSDIKFSGDVLADIYLGKITRWDDPRIAKDNPGVNFSQPSRSGKEDHRGPPLRRQRHQLHLDRLPEQGELRLG